MQCIIMIVRPRVCNFVISTLKEQVSESPVHLEVLYDLDKEGSKNSFPITDSVERDRNGVMKDNESSFSVHITCRINNV